MNRDKNEVDLNKKKLIEEIKSLDKEKMFKKERKTFLDKLLIVFGYGKKR